ncbi:polyphosphate kinase 2 [Falsochrobactrum shanghaiense]|uniref:ADP/GDP-polyphosphate phosphotransferase n=1 Tax=Falsochrobactrum shanghaiense TaxID=2201899 RepID=A0A316JIX8_9HYPH|nr:polyphosphate kinase 2 [Falsochrobactrum shanghaiense]PWL19223.1 polyphosphate kinase 2 [Falsochrobactrum shanghaiense]
MGDSSKTANKKNGKKSSNGNALPVKPIKLKIAGETREFDIDQPKLPGWIDDHALESGGYPYSSKMKEEEYEDTLERLQIELVKMQYWLQETGGRVISVFEGRDAAGKGGTIFTIRQFMNPRTARNVALPKPTETERGQWYFQRYAGHFPTSGEFVTFDRSWYNRAGVERVMEFCTRQQVEIFLTEAPDFERMIITEGIHLFKFWLDIGQEMQLKRFHERRHSALKSWKFSPMDVAGISRWDDYSEALHVMLERTDMPYAPWTIIRSNDKRRARLAAIRRILLSLPYSGRDLEAIGPEDEAIIGRGAAFLASSTGKSSTADT